MRRTFLLASVVTMAVVLVVWLAGASASTKFRYAVKAATSASAPSGPNARAHACRAGFVHVLVRGKHVCRAAPDLRVAVTATPSANRVGGTITFAVTVTNAGRAVSRRVVLGAVAPAEYVSASASVGTCSSPPGVLRTTCALGTLRPKAKATATISVRATALGPLRLSARASSATPDAKARDNSTSNAARITEPDSVRGSGRRLLFGTTGQENAIFVEVDAISGPQGEDPAGTWFTRNPETAPAAGELRGRVVCVSVQGNRATVAGIIEQSTNPQYAPGTGVLLAFTDNGEQGIRRSATTTKTLRAAPLGTAASRSRLWSRGTSLSRTSSHSRRAHLLYETLGVLARMNTASESPSGKSGEGLRDRGTRHGRLNRWRQVPRLPARFGLGVRDFSCAGCRAAMRRW